MWFHLRWWTLVVSFKEGLTWHFLWEKWYSVIHCPLSMKMLWNSADKLLTKSDYCSLPVVAKEKSFISDLNISFLCHEMPLLTQDVLAKPFFQQTFNAWLLCLGQWWVIFIDLILLTAGICQCQSKFSSYSLICKNDKLKWCLDNIESIIIPGITLIYFSNFDSGYSLINNKNKEITLKMPIK